MPKGGSKNSQAARAVLSLLGIAGILVFLVVVFTQGSTHQIESPSAATANVAQAQTSSDKPIVYALGDTIIVGPWKVQCNGVLSAKSFGSTAGVRVANAGYLNVGITVENDGRTAATIPSFQLVDTEGREYDESNDTTFLDNGFGLLWESLNPGVAKTGRVLFDVPLNREYNLKVSDQDESSQFALIALHNLSEAPSMPSSGESAALDSAAKGK